MPGSLYAYCIAMLFDAFICKIGTFVKQDVIVDIIPCI